MEEIKIPLQPIERSLDPYLQIERNSNGDLFIRLKGQDKKGRMVESQAQLVNPVHGGNKELTFQYEFFTKMLNEYTNQNKR